MRIKRTNDLRQEEQRRIGQIVFLQDRIQGNIFAVMAKLAVRHVIDDAVLNRCRVGHDRWEWRLQKEIATNAQAAMLHMTEFFSAFDPMRITANATIAMTAGLRP